MTGLFFDIRNYFDQKYSGRYLALLLREFALREPREFAKLIGLSKDNLKSLVKHELEVKVEWSLPNKRRADLAVLRGGSPLVLFEVKEDDVNAPGNAAQLSDYLKTVKLSGGLVKFVHISRYAIPTTDLDAIKRSSVASRNILQLRYRNIFEFLRKSRSIMSRMICDYLEDIAVASYKVLDMSPRNEGRSLAFLLTQLLGFPHSHRLGRLQSDKAIDDFPDLIKRLFGNLEVLGEWVGSDNGTLFNTRFTLKCLPSPRFDLGKLKAALEKNANNIGARAAELPGRNSKFIKSGTLHFYGEGKIRTGNSSEWLYVELGYAFEISVRGKDESKKSVPVKLRVYGGFRWNDGEEGYYSEKIFGNRFPSESKITKALARLLGEAREKAVASRPASPTIRFALKQFTIPAPA